MVFHWSLSNINTLQLFRTLLSIQADLNHAVVWIVSTCPLISKSSSVFTNPFGGCTKCTNYDWYHRHFHVPSFFFSSLARSRYLSFFSLSFIFILGSAGTAKSTILQVVFFFSFCWPTTSSGRLAEIIIIYSFRVFHITISWWFFTWVWVTASLLKSPGLFSVFSPFSVMLPFG